MTFSMAMSMSLSLSMLFTVTETGALDIWFPKTRSVIGKGQEG
jgi:hypothetical protein